MPNTTNVFSKGLQSDLHPVATDNQTYTDALNATFVTYNGNEAMMQNDMGNTKIQDSKTGNIMGLREGFIPVGLKEHGGVMYIASVNKDGEGEIGTIPSPVIRYDEGTSFKENFEGQDWNIPTGSDVSELRILTTKGTISAGEKFSIAMDVEDTKIKKSIQSTEDQSSTIVVQVPSTADSNNSQTTTHNKAYKFVDLSLPSGNLWATENLKVLDKNNKEVDAQYAFGETEAKTEFTEDNYNHYTISTAEEYTEETDKYGVYNSDGSECTLADTSLTTLALEDDAARQLWGGTWRMPTIDEIKALGNTPGAKFDISNNKLLIVTENEYLYFPQGEYLSSSLKTPLCIEAYGLSVIPSLPEGNLDRDIFPAWRTAGRKIRPVKSITKNIENNNHEYVDLGLPSGTMWATCNIGALHENDYGDYFAWGETDTKNYYNWLNEGEYKYGFVSNSNVNLTKYNSIDNKTILDISDDAARVNWGGGWQTPTKEQFEELFNENYCTIKYVQHALSSTDVRFLAYGFLITSKQDSSKSIFLPTTGYASNSDRLNKDEAVYYMTSELSDSRHIDSYTVLKSVNNSGELSPSLSTALARALGTTIRPVLQSQWIVAKDPDAPEEKGLHDWVYMGGSVVWATENIKDEQGNDLYFAWGETEPKEEYTWENYKYNPANATLRIIVSKNLYLSNTLDEDGNLKPENDAATLYFKALEDGCIYKIPTKEDWEELFAYAGSVNTENAEIFNGALENVAFAEASYATATLEDSLTVNSISLTTQGDVKFLNKDLIAAYKGNHIRAIKTSSSNSNTNTLGTYPLITLVPSINNQKRGLYKMNLYSLAAGQTYNLSDLVKTTYQYAFSNLKAKDLLKPTYWYYDTKDNTTPAELLKFDIDNMLVADHAEDGTRAFMMYPNIPDGQLAVALEKETMGTVQISPNKEPGHIYPITYTVISENEEGGTETKYYIGIPELWYTTDSAVHVDKFKMTIQNEKTGHLVQLRCGELSYLDYIYDTTSTTSQDNIISIRRFVDSELISSNLETVYKLVRSALPAVEYYQSRLCLDVEKNKNNPRWDTLYQAIAKNNMLAYFETDDLDTWYKLTVTCYDEHWDDPIKVYTLRFNLYYFDALGECSNTTINTNSEELELYYDVNTPGTSEAKFYDTTIVPIKQGVSTLALGTDGNPKGEKCGNFYLQEIIKGCKINKKDLPNLTNRNYLYKNPIKITWGVTNPDSSSKHPEYYLKSQTVVKNGDKYPPLKEDRLSDYRIVQLRSDDLFKNMNPGVANIYWRPDSVSGDTHLGDYKTLVESNIVWGQISNRSGSGYDYLDIMVNPESSKLNAIDTSYSLYNALAIRMLLDLWVDKIPVGEDYSSFILAIEDYRLNLYFNFISGDGKLGILGTDKGSVTLSVKGGLLAVNNTSDKITINLNCFTTDISETITLSMKVSVDLPSNNSDYCIKPQFDYIGSYLKNNQLKANLPFGCYYENNVAVPVVTNLNIEKNYLRVDQGSDSNNASYYVGEIWEDEKPTTLDMPLYTLPAKTEDLYVEIPAGIYYINVNFISSDAIKSFQSTSSKRFSRYGPILPGSIQGTLTKTEYGPILPGSIRGTLTKTEYIIPKSQSIQFTFKMNNEDGNPCSYSAWVSAPTSAPNRSGTYPSQDKIMYLPRPAKLVQISAPSECYWTSMGMYQVNTTLDTVPTKKLNELIENWNFVGPAYAAGAADKIDYDGIYNTPTPHNKNERANVITPPFTYVTPQIVWNYDEQVECMGKLYSLTFAPKYGYQRTYATWKWDPETEKAQAAKGGGENKTRLEYPDGTVEYVEYRTLVN